MNNLNCIRFRLERVWGWTIHFPSFSLFSISIFHSQTITDAIRDSLTQLHSYRWRCWEFESPNEVRLMNARWADAKSCSFCVALWLHFKPTLAPASYQPSAHCIVDFFYFLLLFCVCVLWAFRCAVWPAVRCHQFNVIGYLYQKSIAFSISFSLPFNRCWAHWAICSLDS